MERGPGWFAYLGRALWLLYWYGTQTSADLFVGGRALLRGVNLLLFIALAACQCAPGCLPLQGVLPQGGSDAATAAALVGGSCYTLNSAASTPNLSVLPGSSSNSSSSYSTTWASTSAASPVLDLCNQVQSIWLLESEYRSVGWSLFF